MSDEERQPDRTRELRQAAEEAFARSRTSLAPTPGKGTENLLHELQVYQIELEIQNEELRRAQEELNLSRARYFDLYDLAPVGYCTVSEKGLILEANLAAATLLGVSRGALVKQLFTRFILEEDQNLYYLHRELLFQTGEQQSFELRMVKNDETAFWAHLEAITALDADGAPVCRITLNDNTDGKQSAVLLQEFIENNPMSVQIVDKDGFTLKVNPAHTLLFGAVPPSDFSIFTDLQRKYPDSEKTILLAKKGEVARFPDLYYNANDVSSKFPDKLVCIRAILFPLSTNGGIVDKFVMMHENITERKQAEDALRESENKYRQLIETMQDGVYRSSHEGRFLEVNSAMAKILGYDNKEELLAIDIPSQLYFAPDDRQSAALNEKLTEMGVFRLRKKDGSEIWVEDHGRHVVDDQGTILYHEGILRDITERKLAEVELQKLASVVRYSSELVNLATLDGKMIFLNEAGSRMLGISANELGQINIMQVIPDTFKEIVENELMPALGKTGAWAGDLQYVNLQTGQITDVHAITFVVKDPMMEEPMYLANVSIDITERKRAEESLRESEERYRSILNASPDAIAITDLESRILMVSPVALTMFGCRQEERLLGRLLSDFIVPEDREHAWSNVALMFQGIMTGPGDYRGLRIDGSTFDMEANGEFIRGADGQPTSMVFIIRDITERKQLEAEVDRARAEFLFAVSHELKTPLLVLSATQEMLEILPEEQQVERFRDYGFVWRSNLLRLRHIIENLVDSQRMPGMGMKLEKQLLSAAAIAAEVIKELEPVALTKRVKLILEAEPLPEVALDSHAWARLLENLLTNAIKFSPTGGEVKTRFTRLDEGFQMSVIDHGSGIAPQAMPFLFEPFYRSPEALRTGIQGTGLGLYVVKTIADAHGCSVEVSSKEGEGTTVTVLFPWGDEGMCRKDPTPSTGKRQALRDTAATSPSSPPAPSPVLLTFIGNSCTLITASDGTRIVSDPYSDFEHPDGLGALPKDLLADAVTVSHAHGDHNNVKGVGGAPQLIMTPGTFQLGMVRITGYAGFEGSPSGPSNNPHIVFVFEINGVKIVHLGDSGPITQPDVLAAIEDADVLLANIDGYVIPLDQIAPFLLQAKVRTFIPTHYSLSASARWQGAPTIDEFITRLPADLAIVRQGSEIQVTPKMPKQMVELASLTLIK